MIYLYRFPAVGRREGIHESVAKDVTAVFKGKTAAQLEALQLQIETKISGKLERVDIGYWESLLSQLKGIFFSTFSAILFPSCCFSFFFKNID